MICPVIDNTASNEIRTAVRYLHAKIISVAEITHELYAVYGENELQDNFLVL
jgi:hypothetical protein